MSSKLFYYLLHVLRCKWCLTISCVADWMRSWYIYTFRKSIFLSLSLMLGFFYCSNLLYFCYDLIRWFKHVALLFLLIHYPFNTDLNIWFLIWFRRFWFSVLNCVRNAVSLSRNTSLMLFVKYVYLLYFTLILTHPIDELLVLWTIRVLGDSTSE